jgi:hypothetical protein
MTNVVTTKSKPVINTLAVNLTGSDSAWKAIIFNCYCHSFDDVVSQIMRATRFSREKCTNITEIAETTGSATVCEGTKAYCENIGRMLGGTGLNVTVIQ